MRKSTTQSNRLTYDGGDLELSLELETRAVGPVVELAGALVDGQGGSMTEIPAYLLRGSRVLDRAETDEHGAFHMTTGLREGLRLCLMLEDDRMVELELGHQRSGRQELWVLRPTDRSP
jgi:hypothetical protein